MLVRTIIAGGVVAFAPHAREEMADDEMDENDVVNVLRCGKVTSARFERGSWRYNVETARFVVVVAFRSEERLVVVTAWREQ